MYTRISRGFHMKKGLLISTLSLGVVAAAFAGVNSGLDKGERVSPFHPQHVAGALKGSDTCFPCTYQNRPQVQAWVMNGDKDTIVGLAKALDSAMGKYSKNEFKAMVVIVAPKDKHAEIEKSGKMMQSMFKNVSVSYLAPDNEAVKSYKINMKAGNTVFAYKNWKVVDKIVDVKADAKGLASLNAAIDTLVK
jgi:hypothetical protein